MREHIELGAPPLRALSEPESGAEASFRADFGVVGMHCDHCARSVTEEVGAIDGVVGVRIELVVGGVSTVSVSSTRPLDRPAVAAAVDEAGYELVDP